MSQSNSPLAAVNEVDAASYLAVSRSFLRQSRMHGNRTGHAPGPKFVRAGRMVRYRLEDLDAWLKAHLTEPTRAIEDL